MSGLSDRLLDPAEFREQRFVALTFDDGFVDKYTAAFPICRELGGPMTVYLVSGFVRREFPMRSADLKPRLPPMTGSTSSRKRKGFRLETRTGRQKRKAYFAVASRVFASTPTTVLEACSQARSYFGKLIDSDAADPA